MDLNMSEDHSFYKDVLDSLYDGVYFVDRNRIITYWNKGAERLTGYSSDRVIGLSCRDNILNHVTVEGVELCSTQCPLAACMEDGITQNADVFLHHADGHRVPVFVRVAPMKNEKGEIIGAVETFSVDAGVKAVRQELHELRENIQMDKLTGVANRRYLEGKLHGVIAELAFNQKATIGLLFIDIDRFKAFNDTYGHNSGDKALSVVASTLLNTVRESGIVGRWGGEEFLAILYEMEDKASLKMVAEKLRNLVEASRIDTGNGIHSVTISVGATLFQETDTPASVVQRADELMYQSKRKGRNRVSVG
jgi:diguanylate cyclase (GGDEF)-like protein/PAS domain S-box-containing protein